MVSGRLPAKADQAQTQHLEAQLLAQLSEEGHVALPLVSEVEVLPHHDQAGAHAADQHVSHKLVSRLHGPVLVKGDDHRQVHPGRGQLLELLLRVGQEQGRRFGPDDAGRMAVEGDHR